jgi:hypothetical protein
METIDDRLTTREYIEQELEHEREALARYSNDRAAQKLISIYEDELRWFEADDEGEVYQLAYMPDSPWIFTRREEAQTWLDNWSDDVGDDIPKPKIVILRMVGREVGNLPMGEY